MSAQCMDVKTDRKMMELIPVDKTGFKLFLKKSRRFASSNSEFGI